MSITLEDLKNPQKMVEMLNRLEERAEKPSSANVNSVAAMAQTHVPGVCPMADCAYCGPSRAQYAQALIKSVRAGFFATMGQAAKDLQMEDQANDLALRFKEIEDKKPLGGIVVGGIWFKP